MSLSSLHNNFDAKYTKYFRNLIRFTISIILLQNLLMIVSNLSFIIVLFGLEINS